MSRFARHKDTAHRPTVIALRAAGASVQAMDIKDGPDLLVGYAGRTLLMEVKTIATRIEKDGYQRTRRGKKSDGQESWHSTWRGGPVHTVYGPEESLIALGLEMHKISNLRTLTKDWTKDITPASQTTSKERPFRPGTDKARSLAETCKVDFCTTSAVPGTNPPRCAAHAAEETFAPAPCPACKIDPQDPCRHDGEEKGVALGTSPPRRLNQRPVDKIMAKGWHRSQSGP